MEEYYAKQGLNISDLDRKKEAKTDPKTAPKADWVAKEKLEFVKTKQDNNLEGETKKVAVLKNQSHKIELAPEQELLGFVNDVPKKREERAERPAEEQREHKEHREHKGEHREHKGGKQQRGKDQTGGNEKGGARNYQERKQAPQPKLVVTEEDFPSL